MRLANGGIFPLFLAEESAFVGGEKNDGNFLFSAEIPCIIASERRGKTKVVALDLCSRFRCQHAK